MNNPISASPRLQGLSHSIINDSINRIYDGFYPIFQGQLHSAFSKFHVHNNNIFVFWMDMIVFLHFYPVYFPLKSFTKFIMCETSFTISISSLVNPSTGNVIHVLVKSPHGRHLFIPWNKSSFGSLWIWVPFVIEIPWISINSSLCLIIKIERDHHDHGIINFRFNLLKQSNFKSFSC